MFNKMLQEFYGIVEWEFVGGNLKKIPNKS